MNLGTLNRSPQTFGLVTNIFPSMATFGKKTQILPKTCKVFIKLSLLWQGCVSKYYHPLCSVSCLSEGNR